MQQVSPEITVRILPFLLIVPLITLAFETCAPPTPVQKVSNTRTTQMWMTRGALMVMTNVRRTWLTVKTLLPVRTDSGESFQAKRFWCCSRGKGDADIVVFTVRHELIGAQLLLFCPLTEKYLAYRTFYPLASEQCAFKMCVRLINFFKSKLNQSSDNK